ncbi:MAG: virulence factor family protein [Xanthomonadales bacterium]|nr:virulence factor family protein [Xanthomonadales bacterium]
MHTRCRWISTGFAILILLVSRTVQAADDQPRYGMFGQLHVQRPPASAGDTILLLSDRGGWSQREDSLARALAAHGARVVGIDLPVYLKRLAAIDDKCSYPAGHFEELAHWIERHEGDADYRAPLVIGSGSGAVFAYAMVAQAPAGTFSALLTLGWDWDFRLSKSICPGDAGVVTVAGPDARYHVVATTVLPIEWLPLPGAHLPGPASELDHLWRELGLPPPQFLQSQVAADVGVTYARWREQQDTEQVALPDDIADLPLIEIAAHGPDSGRIVILLTGDGGWAGLDKGVAEALASDGMRVVGFSTLKFFWQKRSPEVAADALSRTLAHYAKSSPTTRFVIVGYSFGASLVPVLIDRLPATLQARIDRGIMISPDPDAVFEIRIGDWFGNGHHDGTLPVLPAVAASRVPITCIHGIDEADSFCKPGLDPQLGVLSLPGGHHFNGNYAALGGLIVAALKQDRAVQP